MWMNNSNYQLHTLLSRVEDSPHTELFYIQPPRIRRCWFYMGEVCEHCRPEDDVEGACPKAKCSEHYSQFDSQPRWNPSSLRLSRLEWSTLLQLKLGHGYFRSFCSRGKPKPSESTGKRQTPTARLTRLPDYDTENRPEETRTRIYHATGVHNSVSKLIADYNSR